MASLPSIRLLWECTTCEAWFMELEGTPFALAPMAIEDVPTVTTVEQLVFSLPWSATAFTYELRHNPSATYLVLRYSPWIYTPPARQYLPKAMQHWIKPPNNDPSLLGYGGYWMMLEEAHICTLALRDEWRGRGLGEALLAALIESALGRQAEIVTLEVRISNLRAQSLYRKYGFEIVGMRKRYYSDNGEDAHIMSTPPTNTEEYRTRLAQLTQALGERLRQQANTPPRQPLPESLS